MDRMGIMAAVWMLLAGCAGGPENDGSRKMLDGPDDLHGQVICVQTGSTPDLLCSRVYPDSEIKHVEQATDMIMMVSSGKVDAGTMSELVWMPLSDSYPELGSFRLPDCGTDIAMAFPKGSTGLADEFNAFLDTFLVSTEFNEMYDGWVSDAAGRPMPEMRPELCDSGVLTVALSPDQPPYDMMRGNSVAGLEPELVARFALAKHMRVNFVTMNFQALIPYLASGKADMACSIMSITEERSRMVRFSKPWIREEVAFLVRKDRMSLTEGVADVVKPGLWERIRGGFERNVIQEQRYNLLWQGTLMTLVISLLSALFGTMLGVLLCMGAMSRRKVVSKPCDFYIGLMRCMPQVVLLMIMFYIVFGKADVSGTAVAVISFSMCFGAYCSVIFRSALESIDRGQREAALAMGFTPARTFFNFILPQVMQRALPVYKNEFVSLVKATSIVGYIAVSDLTRAGDIIRSRTFEAFFPLIIVTVIYFLIIWLLTLLLRWAELKSRPVVHKYSKKS